MATSLVAPPERLVQALTNPRDRMTQFSSGPTPSSRRRQREPTAEDLDRALAEKRARKLTSVEPQRILVVLDDCLKNLRLSQVLPQLSEDLPRLSVQLGSDIHEQLQRHRQLEESYEELTDNDDQLADELAVRLRDSLREILRLLRENPRALSVLQGEADRTEMLPDSEQLIAEMEQVRGNVYEKLLTSKKEEDERTRYLEELRQRQQWRDDDIARLEESLSRANNDMQAKVSIGKKRVSVADGKQLCIQCLAVCYDLTIRATLVICDCFSDSCEICVTECVTPVVYATIHASVMLIIGT